MMTKQDAVRWLTRNSRGTVAEAAKVLGITEKAMNNWPTDERGHLVRRSSIDMVTAACLREYVMAMATGELDPDDQGLSMESLIDMVTLPAKPVRARADAR